jgi:hypothetical protein
MSPSTWRKGKESNPDRAHYLRQKAFTRSMMVSPAVDSSTVMGAASREGGAGDFSAFGIARS